MRRAVSLVAVFAIAAVLIFAVMTSLPSFGSFPQRSLGAFENQAIGERMLENGLQGTGSANIVTSIVWDYRGYDTMGEATVLFTAVTGVLMLFLATRGHE
jgi:multisubunit Na+/H+ antiporter MnhB subunit